MANYIIDEKGNKAKLRWFYLITAYDENGDSIWIIKHYDKWKIYKQAVFAYGFLTKKSAEECIKEIKQQEGFNYNWRLVKERRIFMPKKGFFEVSVYKKYNKDKTYVNQKPKYYCKADSLVGALQGLLDEARRKNKSYIILINKNNMNGYLNLEFHNSNNNNISLYVINIKETTKDGVEVDWTDRYLLYRDTVTKQYKELINFINNNLTLYLYDYRKGVWIERSSDRYYKCLVNLNIAICNRYTDDIIYGSIDTRHFVATIKCETENGKIIYFPVVKSKRLTKKMKEFIEIYNEDDKLK